MTLRLALLLLRRELSRARARLVYFALCLAAGVAAVVLVAGLSDSVQRSIRLNARPMMAADVVVSGERPTPEAMLAAAALPGVSRARTLSFPTVVAAPPGTDAADGPSLLAELKAVDGPYPFYGELVLDPPGSLAAALDGQGVVVEAELLDRLGLRLGDTLRVGGVPFVIRAIVQREPDRISPSLAQGPRVFLDFEGLERAGLGSSGVRLEHRTLFKVPDEPTATRLVAAMQAATPESSFFRISTWSDGNPQMRQGVERTETWLGLVALLALLVGGVGVAQTVRAWLSSRLDNIAIQRTLGLTATQLTAIYAGLCALLGLAGSLLGAALGTAALAAVPTLLDGVLPAEAVRPFQPAAIAWGLALGTGIALLFSLIPLLRVRAVPPLRVLRRDVEPAPTPVGSRLAGAIGLGLGVWVLAWGQSRSVVLASAFAGATALVAALGALFAEAVSRSLARVGRRARSWQLRHGLVALDRPGAGTPLAVVALGLGVLTVLSTLLVQTRLDRQLTEQIPTDAPSAFLIDVQPDQWPAVESLLVQAGATGLRHAPMIMARIAAIDGRSTDEILAGTADEERWALTREQRLSVVETLPADNRLVAGGPWSDPQRDEISVEQRFAERLGIGVGSALRFDVQGVPFEFVVASVRTVEWESMNMNFFLVVEPGVLDRAPQSLLVTATLPEGRDGAVRDALARQLPNVTLVSVREILVRVRDLLAQLGWSVQLLGAFTALAGVLILTSSAAATALRRGREVALLKTLGATRLDIALVFGVEYAIVGAMAGLLGATGAVAVSWVVVTELMRLDWLWQPGLLLAGVVGAAVLFACTGVAANLAALRTRPALVLRGE